MGYLFLTISVLSGTIKGFCGKKTSGIISNSTDAILSNALRMALCVVIGLALVFVNGETGFLACGTTALLISAMSGISTAIFLFSWLLSVKNGAFMLVEVMLMLGVLVPVVSGIFMFGNSVSLIDWIGIAILVYAAFIMCSYNKSVKGTMSIKNIVTLMVCGLANGTTDLSQKMFVQYSGDVPISVFNFYTYIFAGIVLTILFCVFGAKEKRTVKIKSIIGYISIMALFLFIGSFFKTVAARHLDPAQLYPLFQSGSLILSTLMAGTLFKEKLTIKAIVGIILAFVGIIFINVL